MVLSAHDLKQIREKIFSRLDKEGNYRRVDEGSARDIVSNVIDPYIILLEEAENLLVSDKEHEAIADQIRNIIAKRINKK